MFGVGVVYDVEFVDQCPLGVDEKGIGRAQIVPELPGGFGINGRHHDQLAIIHRQFWLQVLRIILQLETTFSSPDTAIEDDDGRPTAHVAAQLLDIAILIW